MSGTVLLSLIIPKKIFNVRMRLRDCFDALRATRIYRRMAFTLVLNQHLIPKIIGPIRKVCFYLEKGIENNS